MQPPASPSESHYRDFFENVTVGLFAVSPEGRLLDANPALVRILRYASRENLFVFRIRDLLNSSRQCFSGLFR